MNRRIMLPVGLHEPYAAAGSRSAAEAPYAECDFVFVKDGKTVVVDYHGEWSHSGEGSIHHDSLRSNAFTSLGFTYFTLTKWQFFDLGLLDKVARQIGAALGRKPRVRFDDYDRRKILLHAAAASAVRRGFFDMVGD